jgi:hypothetical protein
MRAGSSPDLSYLSLAAEAYGLAQIRLALVFGSSRTSMGLAWSGPTPEPAQKGGSLAFPTPTRCPGDSAPRSRARG